MCGKMVTSCGMKRTSHCALHLRAGAEHMNNTNAHTPLHNPYGIAGVRSSTINIYIYNYIYNQQQLMMFMMFANWSSCTEKKHLPWLHGDPITPVVDDIMVIHSRHWKSLDNQDIILYHTNNHNKSKSGISLVETLPNGIYSTMVAFPDGIPNDQRLWLLFLAQLIQLALVFQQLSQQRLHCGSEDVGFILRKRKMEILILP